MTLKKDLYDLFQPLVGGSLIFMDNNAPRPNLPYSAMKVMSVRYVNYDHYGDPDEDGVQKVNGDREFTLNIQRFQSFSDGDVTSVLQGVVDKLRLTSVRQKFYEKGLVPFDTDSVTDISKLLDEDQIEKRATLDIMIRFKSRLEDQVGLIEKVEIEVEFDLLDPPAPDPGYEPEVTFVDVVSAG